MPDEPDLMTELDDADLIISGEAAEVRTEWGVRYEDDGEVKVAIRPTERAATILARPYNLDGTLVTRRIVVGEWTDG